MNKQKDYHIDGYNLELEEIWHLLMVLFSSDTGLVHDMNNALAGIVGSLSVAMFALSQKTTKMPAKTLKKLRKHIQIALAKAEQLEKLILLPLKDKGVIAQQNIFVSKPAEIVAEISHLFPSIDVRISSSSLKSLELLYPRRTM